MQSGGTSKMQEVDDYINLSILPNVDLALEPVSRQTEPSTGSARRYKVIGPAAPLDFLRGLGERAKSCSLSPPARVTVPLKVRAAAGIPKCAETFAFIYPWMGEMVGGLDLSHNAWAFVMLFGGFAYFNKSGDLLSVNAITLDHSEQGLMLVGPSIATPAAVSAMQAKDRMTNITAPTLTRAGFRQFGWVHPSEHFDGELMGTVAYPDGAFMYVRQKLTADDGPVGEVGVEASYYTLVSPQDKLFKQLRKQHRLRTAASERASAANERATAPPPSSRVVLSAAFAEEMRRSTDAVNVKRAAANMVTLHDSAHRMAPSTMAILKETVQALIILGSYIGIGMGFYLSTGNLVPCSLSTAEQLASNSTTALEDVDAFCQWSAIDAIYFIMCASVRMPVYHLR